MTDLLRWMDDHSGPEWIWSVKYLSANDTYAKTNVHQGGPHVSRALLAAAFPRLCERAERERNPDAQLPAIVDSHSTWHQLRLVWYNSRRARGQANGRDEARLTRWGRMDSPVVAPESTGSLAVFAFHARPGRDAEGLRIWLCRSVEEEVAVLARVGEVVPGRGIVFPPGAGRAIDGQPAERDCFLAPDELPAAWRDRFPTGEELVQWVLAHRPLRGRSADERLMARRSCEYRLFRSVEDAHVLPRIAAGFRSVDEFVAMAGEILNRRKSRSGRSLELHVRALLDEAGVPYSWGASTEGNRVPDFIFPSIERYRSPDWPAERLLMLGVKTTCKDRWRQILSEAERIPVKHLLTLQEGVSVQQFAEMREQEVRLVVPRPLVRTYPEAVRPELVSVEYFIHLAGGLSTNN